MALENFVTSTEVKDGLTSLDRVKDLIETMQKEKDHVFENIDDASRQLSTVANVIAVTENKDCLDLFVESDGKQFIDKWLNDVQKFGDDSGNKVFEELKSALMRALEKVQIDNVKSVVGDDEEKKAEDKVEETEDSSAGAQTNGGDADADDDEEEEKKVVGNEEIPEGSGSGGVLSKSHESGFDLNEDRSEEDNHPVDSVSTNGNSKQRSDRFNFDLNDVADDNDDKFESKNLIVSGSGIPSGEESSVNASPALLHLDLNSPGDESIDIVVLNRNNYRSPSQSSSSSSMNPSMKHIDLNHDDNSVFTLLGTQVHVNHKEVVPQPNRILMGPTFNGGWGVGSSVGAYGDNGAPFPSSSFMHFPSLFGPAGSPGSLMVDPCGPTVAGPSQHNLSLNDLGYMVNGGNGAGLTWNEGSSGSGVGGKRKEPESGFDIFPDCYKQAPWK